MRKVRQSSRRKERKVRKRGKETCESDNDEEKGEKTETEGKDMGEGRKRSTEATTSGNKDNSCHVEKQHLGGHGSHNNKR